MNAAVDHYVFKAKNWQEEIVHLRAIIQTTDLKEEFKWGNPCYTLNGKNVVLIHVFKDYCALLFFKGALMDNADGLLIQQTENVQAARQLRFTNLKEIIKYQKQIKACLKDAIKLEQEGKKVELKKTDAFVMVAEFEKALSKDKILQKAFSSLTPGRQRAYLLFFSSAKQTKTREDRIQKCASKIKSGKGLND